MSMEVDWLALNSVIHMAEELKIPFPSSKTIMIAGIVGVPIAVFLHDTADRWLPHSLQIPVLSWFQRRWRKDPQNKPGDVATFRNLLIFAWIVAALGERTPKFSPLDYVADRLCNSTTRKLITSEIQKKRGGSFGAARDVMEASAYDDTKTQQLRDAALRRRHIQQSGMKE